MALDRLIGWAVYTEMAVRSSESEPTTLLFLHGYDSWPGRHLLQEWRGMVSGRILRLP